jgi:hypothetical protein
LSKYCSSLISTRGLSLLRKGWYCGKQGWPVVFSLPVKIIRSTDWQKPMIPLVPGHFYNCACQDKSAPPGEAEGLIGIAVSKTAD